MSTSIAALKAKRARYNHSAKGIAVRRAYQKSARGRSIAAAYARSPKGRAKVRQHYYKHTVPQIQKIGEIKLARGCMDCGYNTHPAALDFDHRPGETKSFQISGRKSMQWESLLIEMNKCDVVCANCHRIRTVNRRMEVPCNQVD